MPSKQLTACGLKSAIEAGRRIGRFPKKYIARSRKHLEHLAHLAKEEKISTSDFTTYHTLTQNHGGLSQDMATYSPAERMYTKNCSILLECKGFMYWPCRYRQKKEWKFLSYSKYFFNVNTWFLLAHCLLAFIDKQCKI